LPHEEELGHEETPLDRGVYIDKDKQQEVKYDADDSEHSQESLLLCAQIWTRQLHLKTT